MRRPDLVPPEDASGVQIDFVVRTMEEIRPGRPATIYYAVSSCWWTHDPRHLHRVGFPGGRITVWPPEKIDEARELARHCGGYLLPSCPRGSVLMEADAEAFLARAEEHADHYGRHGLRALLAAHHLNCSRYFQPWSMRTWESYNQVLDQQDALR